jgi:hypothetical protein
MRGPVSHWIFRYSASVLHRQSDVMRCTIIWWHRFASLSDTMPMQCIAFLMHCIEFLMRYQYMAIYRITSHCFIVGGTYVRIMYLFSTYDLQISCFSKKAIKGLKQPPWVCVVLSPQGILFTNPVQVIPCQSLGSQWMAMFLSCVCWRNDYH